MRIPLSWIDQFTPLPSLRIEEISRCFTLSSCEVEAVLACLDSTMPELWSQVQLVEVLRLEAHPNAEKLLLPTIATGNGEVQLVCGANNLYPGLKTLWGPEGTELRSGYDGQNFVLKNKAIMGIMSCGMLFSERELGLSDDHEGIIDLGELAQQPNISLGMSLAQILSRCLKPKEPLQLNGTSISGIQFILEVDNKSLTHRPDMWGIYGISREFGAVFPKNCAKDGGMIGPSSFLAPYDESWLNRVRQNMGTQVSPMTLEIAPDSSCLSYCALSMDAVQIKESPEWLQQRLRLAGVSIINSVVDISNYVMIELGIPNHIFDRDKLSGDKIYVYPLKEAQDFQTLDGQQRQLQAGDTVVADRHKPQAIAGIMGGVDSSVGKCTQRILLEVAVWDSHAVHTSSVRLGLRSDSALRYEKSLDPYSIERSLWRLCQLIREIHPETKVCGLLESYYQKPESPFFIETSVSQISQVLGYPLDKQTGQKLVRQIFDNLGFRSKSTAELIQVELPSYRTSKDLYLEEDLIEEVGRIIGYDNILPQSPLAVIRPSSLGSNQQLAREIRNFLVLNGGLQEVLSYPLIGAKLLEQAHWQGETLYLANPLNPEQDRLRPSLIPSHLELVGRNAHGNRLHQFCIFELGRSYHSKQKMPLQPQEQQHLIISSYSDTSHPILELRNLSERLLRYLGAPSHSWKNAWEVWPQFIPLNWDGVHPHQRLCWQNAHNQRYPNLKEAWLFSVHPSLLHELKLKGKLALACIPLGPVPSPKDERAARKQSAIQFQTLQRFPSVEFDCTVVVPPRVLAAEAVQALEQGVRKRYPRMASLLQKILVRSVYPIPQRSDRWLTLQCLFADPSSTLHREEIKQLEDQTVAILQDAGFSLKMEDAQ